MNRFPDLPEPDFWALRHRRDVFHAERCAVLGRNNGLLDVLHVFVQTEHANIDLLEAQFDKAAPRVRVVVAELLFYLGNAHAVLHEFVGIHLYLVFARRSPKADNVDNVGNGLELFL